MSAQFNPAVLFATQFPEYGTGKHLITADDHYKVCENDPYQAEQLLIGELIAEIPNGMQAFYVGTQFKNQPTGQKMLRATPAIRIRLIKATIIRVLFAEGLGNQFEYRRKRHYKILCEGLITNLLKRRLPFTTEDFQFIIESLKSLRETAGDMNHFVLNFPYEWLWKALEVQLKKEKDNVADMREVLLTFKEITPYKIPLHQKIDVWLKNSYIKLSTHDIFGKTVMQFLKNETKESRQQWEKLLILCGKYDANPEKFEPEIKTLMHQITPPVYYQTLARWFRVTVEHEPTFDFGNLLTAQNQRILQNLINTIIYLRHPIFWRLIARLGAKAHQKGDTQLTNFCATALEQSTKLNQDIQTIGDGITHWLAEQTKSQLAEAQSRGFGDTPMPQSGANQESFLEIEAMPLV